MLGLLSPTAACTATRSTSHALARAGAARGRARRSVVHAFLDGRDTPPQSAAARSAPTGGRSSRAPACGAHRVGRSAATTPWTATSRWDARRRPPTTC
ncbi:MAG: hypothetical protein MZV65_20335 [Chromatiales bacterium]|nr:hypothetical protein [Chromatiales bacterium]